MTYKRRLLAVLLCALLFAASLVSIPALATEGEPMGSGGVVIVFPTEAAPPTPTPTPVPTPIPTPEPTPEPAPAQQDPDNGYYYPGGGTTTQSTPSPAPTPTPTPSLQPSATPLPTKRPTPQPGIISTPGPGGSSNSKYVTFAKVDLQSNSRAVVLFYIGMLIVILGLLGLMIFLFMAFQRRRRLRLRKELLREDRAGREKIFRAIEDAENRQHSPISSTPELITTPGERPRSSYGDRLPELSEIRRPVPDEPKAPAVVEEAPAQTPPPEKRLPHGAIVPMAASVYTDEFSLDDLEDEDPEEEETPQAPAPEAAPQRPLAARLRQTAHQPEPPDEEDKDEDEDEEAEVLEEPAAPRSAPEEAPAATREIPAVKAESREDPVDVEPTRTFDKILPEEPGPTKKAENPARRTRKTEHAALAEKPVPAAEPTREIPAVKAPAKPEEDVAEQLDFSAFTSQKEEAPKPQKEAKKEKDPPDHQLPGQLTF